MEQEANAYLKNRLTNIGSYQLTPEEQKKAAHDRAGFIMDKITRKKFRRRLGDDTRKNIERKVRLSVDDDRPIHFTIPFGGYKHFWNESHPEPDWAELFHLRWMTDYVLPILAVHKPGVVLEYISEDLILPRMNNYPDAAIEAYSAAFHKLQDWYRQYLPKNLELRYWRVSDRCDKQALVKKVESLIPERKAAFTKLTPEAQEREIHRSLRSVFWDGRQDLSKLSEQEKRDRIIESRIIELAFYATEAEPEFMGNYYGDDNHICACFSFGLSPDNEEFLDLTLQTAPGSIVDYWIGRGVLKQQGGELYGTIISRQQYEAAREKLLAVPVTTLKVPGKNYRSIEIEQ